MKTFAIMITMIGLLGSVYASQTTTILNAISTKISVNDSEKATIFVKAFNN